MRLHTPCFQFLEFPVVFAQYDPRNYFKHYKKCFSVSVGALCINKYKQHSLASGSPVSSYHPTNLALLPSQRTAGVASSLSVISFSALTYSEY